MLIPTRHDAFFKFAFSDARHAASAIRGILPPELRDQIDFDAFELQPGSYVDEELASRHTDLMFRTRLTGSDEPAWVYLLFEHQSSTDQTMPLRMLGYMVRAWTDFVRDTPGEPLPPIVPIVLYHGPTSWSAPTALAGMFSEEVRVRFDGLLPTARFVLEDLSTVSDQALRARAMTGLATITLGALKHVHDGVSLLELLASSGEALHEIWHAPNGMRAIQALTRYILSNNEVSDVAMGETLGALLGDVAQEVAVTTAQRLYKEGREEGREEERAQGALTLLSKRFGALNDAESERFEALGMDGLAVIFEGIFTAADIDDLLTQAEQVDPANDDDP